MFFYIFIFISWAVYFFRVPFLYDVLHLTADLFTAGKSDIKVLFLLIVVMAVVLLNRVPPDSKASDISRKYARAFFAATAGFFLFGIWTFFVYYRDFSAGLNSMLVALSENDLSTTYFLHSHVLKSAFGIVFSVLPSFLQRNADLGVAYGAILPAYIAWVGLAGFLSLLLLACVLTVQFIKTNRTHLTLQVLFAVAIFALFKNVFDGGFFNYETIPAFIVVWILIYGTSFTWKVAAVPMFLQAAPVVYLFISYQYGTVDSHGVAEYLRTFICQELVYLGWYVLSTQKLSRTLGLLMLILGLIGGVATVLNRANYIVYGYENLNQQTAYLGTYGALPASVGQLQEKIGNIFIYRLQPHSDISVNDVLKMTHDNSTYFPISIEWDTCLPTSGEIDSIFNIVSKEKLTIPALTHQFMSIADITQKGVSTNGWNNYLVTFSGLSCVPRPIDIIQELLKEAGGVHMVMVLPFNENKNNNTLSHND